MFYQFSAASVVVVSVTANLVSTKNGKSKRECFERILKDSRRLEIMHLRSDHTSNAFLAFPRICCDL